MDGHYADLIIHHEERTNEEETNKHHNRDARYKCADKMFAFPQEWSNKGLHGDMRRKQLCPEQRKRLVC